MVTPHESPAAREEGRQLNQPTTLGKPLGVLMLPDTVNKRVEALGTLSRQGKRINGLYRLMESPDMWLKAYAKIYANTGATTKGVDSVTMDGFARERIEKIVTLLKENRY